MVVQPGCYSCTTASMHMVWASCSKHAHPVVPLAPMRCTLCVLLYCCIHRLPEKYILVPQPQGVVVKYLLLFSDDALLGHTAAGQQGRPRRGAAALCMYVTVAYVVFMLLLPMWSSLSRSSSW